MRLSRIHRAATFSAPEGMDGSAAMTMLRDAIKKADPTEIVEHGSALDFDVGPLPLRISPFDAFWWIRRGHVSVRSSGSSTVEVTFDLQVARSFVVAAALFFLSFCAMAVVDSANPSGPGLAGVALVGGLVVIWWLLIKAFTAARFGSFVEAALRPLRPTDASVSKTSTTVDG